MAVVDGDAVDPATYSLMGPAGLRVRKNPLESLVMGLTDEATSGTYWMVSATQYKTTGQSLQVALAPNQTPLARSVDTAGILKTVGYLHCDSGFTVGVFCAVYASKIELGTFTRTSPSSSPPTLPATLPATFGGSDGFTYTVVKTWTATQAISLSARIEIKNAPGSTAFSVLLDDAIVIDNVTVPATLNATTRNNAAVAIQRASFGDDQKQDSPWLSGFTVSDYIPQAYLGSGAVMSKVGGASANSVNAAGVGALLPASYFNNIPQRTTDIACDLTTGKFTVTVEGPYLIKLAISSLATTPTGGLTFYLYRNGTRLRSGAFFPPGSVSGYYAMGIWPEYLLANDYVQIGYLNSAATANQFAGGDVLGANIHFSITLQARKVV